MKEKKCKFSVFILLYIYLFVYYIHYCLLNSSLSEHLLSPCYFGAGERISSLYHILLGFM
jgi:hypothetical protein